jgi:hypothetical protein
MRGHSPIMGSRYAKNVDICLCETSAYNDLYMDCDMCSRQRQPDFDGSGHLFLSSSSLRSSVACPFPIHAEHPVLSKRPSKRLDLLRQLDIDVCSCSTIPMSSDIFFFSGATRFRLWGSVSGKSQSYTCHFGKTES